MMMNVVYVMIIAATILVHAYDNRKVDVNELFNRKEVK